MSKTTRRVNRRGREPDTTSVNGLQQKKTAMWAPLCSTGETMKKIYVKIWNWRYLWLYVFKIVRWYILSSIIVSCFIIITWHLRFDIWQRILVKIHCYQIQSLTVTLHLNYHLISEHFLNLNERIWMLRWCTVYKN